MAIVLGLGLILCALPQRGLAQACAVPETLDLLATGVAEPGACGIARLIGPRAPPDPAQARAAFAAGRFEIVDGPRVGTELSDSGLWLRLDLLNASGDGRSYVMAAGQPYIRHLSVWLETAGGLGPVLQEGDDRPFSDRPAPVLEIVSDSFYLPQGARAQLWLYAEFDGLASLTPRVFPSALAGEIALRRELPQMLFYAVSAVMLTLMVGLGWALRSKPTLLYAGFFLGLLLYNLQLDGALFRWLWPWAPGWNAVASHPIGLLAVAFALLFAREFTATGQHTTWLRRTQAALLGLVVALMLAPLVVPLVHVKQAMGPVLLVFLLTQAWSAVVAMRDRVPGSGFYLIATLVFFGYLGLFVVLSQTGIDPGFPAGLVLRVGQLVDGVIFCAATLRLTEILRRRERSAEIEAQVFAQRVAAERHDLRQPLLSLRLAVAQLGNDDGTARAQMQDSLQYLQNLLTPDPGDVQQAPAAVGTVPEPAPAFPLQDLFDTLGYMFGPEAAARGATLRIMPTSLRVVADQVDLLRAVSNLVSNAVAHSGSDRIVLGARRDGACLRIEVLDRGVGMAAPGGGRGGHEGLGLGIVTDVCARHGWRLALVPLRPRGLRATLSGLQFGQDNP